MAWWIATLGFKPMLGWSFPMYKLTTAKVGDSFPAFINCKLVIPIGVGVSLPEQCCSSSHSIDPSRQTQNSRCVVNRRFIILLLWCPGGRVCLERLRPRRIEAGPADGRLRLALCRALDASRRSEGACRWAPSWPPGTVCRRHWRRDTCGGARTSKTLASSRDYVPSSHRKAYEEGTIKIDRSK